MKAIIGKKIGMSQIFDESGRVTPVTVLSVDNLWVSRHLSTNDKPTHFELGTGKQKRPNMAASGVYKQLGFVPQVTRAFKLADDASIPEVGTEVKATIFEAGEKVEVTGITKGKGFQGGVKRWGFKGGPKTHGGTSGKHRSPGSIGPGTTPGKVVKGKRMAGHMGFVQKTIKNLKVAQVDAESNLLAISGALPGPKGAYMIVKAK